ncbi:MAG: NAD-dependent epimerase/dehydratase [Deltaproteobacteria bacterium]|nr:NAD-dependent epimerase/dehydratase [Deltaproteobacteria bacterium]
MIDMMDAPVLIIGGAGFIGSNLAARFAAQGYRVRIYDSLSRPGVEQNLAWLQMQHGDRIEAEIADVRDRVRLRGAVAGARAVFHFAAQVATTTSLLEPRHDFEVNAWGTLEVLEALRVQATPPPLVFASTNKVYGSLQDVPMMIEGSRWRPTSAALAATGIDERRGLAFRTPQGCSKGAADQYVLDYAHSFGLPATVLRMSCIYGPRQLGTEDQGWVAHFLICALRDQEITIYGDGRQVRDVLFVDDLIDALDRAWTHIDAIRGRAFNIGGGPGNSISLVELVDLISLLRGSSPDIAMEGWRAGDQRYYVSDPSAFTAATGWRPRISPRAGVEALYGWLLEQRRRIAGSRPLTSAARVPRA